MKKKYVRIRVWKESYDNMLVKKKLAQNDLRKTLGIKGNITFTRMFHAMSIQPFTLPYDVKLRSLVRRKNRRL